MIEDATKASEYNYGNAIVYDPVKMETAMTNAIEQDMDVFSSQEALDNQRAYYKVLLVFSSCIF